MRRPLLMLPAVAAVVALGCNDGPNDNYQAAPPNAGWNDGNGTSATDAGQAYDAGYPTSSKTQICSTDVKRLRWAWMLTQPIIPPRQYAGLDMAKNDNWDGLRIEDAEQPPAGDPQMPGGGLCQSVPFGFEGTCPSGYGGCNNNAWGNNSEVAFSWNVATHLVDQMALSLGYTGVMKTDPYTDHNGEKHYYQVGVGDVVRRDGVPYEIQWNSSATRAVQITDIFNAVMATFSQKAGVPFDTSTCMADTDCKAPGTSSVCECTHAIDPATMKPTASCDTTVNPKGGQCGFRNCGTDGNCLIYNDGSNTIFGIRPMVVYFEGTAGVPQPALSTPYQVYNFFSKWEPYSNLPQKVKLDENGPLASGSPIGGAAGSMCTQQIGQTFGDMRKNCVQVSGDSTVNTVNLNKITHSLTHDQEHWTANVLGVNQNFTSGKVLADPNAVVLDGDMPQDTDVAQDWTFDVRARGQVANDYAFPAGFPNNTGALPEFRGSNLVMIEWARLMLEDMARILGNPTPTQIGDPNCTGFDPATNEPNYKLLGGGKCTGIEGMMFPDAAESYVPPSNETDFSNDPDAASAAIGKAAYNNLDSWGIYASILKPGDIHGLFCIDPSYGNIATDCTGDQGVSIWQNALKHVTRVLGNGDILNLPSELRDRRYYFRWFGIAYVKYLKAYGEYAKKYPGMQDNIPDGTVGHGLGISDVHNQLIDLESLFFDYTVQVGAGSAQTFDKFEYIDRQYIGQGVGGTDNYIPFDFEYGTDLFGGNQRYDNWFRRMDREEIALFASMLEDKTHTPGQENNVNITNMFGSVLLGGDPDSAIAGLWPSYACAIGQSGNPKSCFNHSLVDPITYNYLLATAPLEPVQSGAPCGSCAAGQVCGGGRSFEAGWVTACGAPCDFTTYPKSGCASPTQTCAGTSIISKTGACVDMKMDDNGYYPGNKAIARPILAAYPGAWGRSPWARGHSPVTIAAADKHPNIGVSKPTIPNFKAGPYVRSPLLATRVACAQDADCGAGNTCDMTTKSCLYIRVT